MRVLTYTSLFPNCINRNLGGFVAKRMSCWAKKYATQWSIVAPVPYFPSLPFNSPWRRYSDIPLAESFMQWDVYHFRYGMMPKIGLPIQGISMGLCTIGKVKEVIHECGPFDLIDAHFIYPDAFAALEICQKLGIPLVASARGSDINYYGQMNVIKPMITKVLKQADAVIGVSQDLIEKMIVLGAPEERCHHIFNGVDGKLFFPYGFNQNKDKNKNLLAVGNLVPEKGFDVLLMAIASLKSSYPGLQLNIIGSGPQLPKLSTLCNELEIENNVRFIGQVKHEKINEWFRNSDVFCLSSLREGNPNVVMEALSSGLPVASTPVGGVPELIHNHQNGILSLDYSPQSLANAIREVLEREWSAIDIHKTVSHRTWEAVADEVQAVFKKVSKGSC